MKVFLVIIANFAQELGRIVRAMKDAMGTANAPMTAVVTVSVTMVVLRARFTMRNALTMNFAATGGAASARPRRKRIRASARQGSMGTSACILKKSAPNATKGSAVVRAYARFIKVA